MSVKAPLIQECPCCGEYLSRTLSDPTVKPVAVNRVENFVMLHTLHWHCLACGARWEHGQYEDEGFELKGDA